MFASQVNETSVAVCLLLIPFKFTFDIDQYVLLMCIISVFPLYGDMNAIQLPLKTAPMCVVPFSDTLQNEKTAERHPIPANNPGTKSAFVPTFCTIADATDHSLGSIILPTYNLFTFRFCRSANELNGMRNVSRIFQNDEVSDKLGRNHLASYK